MQILQEQMSAHTVVDNKKILRYSDIFILEYRLTSV